MFTDLHISKYYTEIKNGFNKFYEEREPWDVMLDTCVAMITLCFLAFSHHIHLSIFDDGFKPTIVRFIRKLPIVRGQVAREMRASVTQVEKSLHKGMQDKVYLTELPQKPWTMDTIIKEIDKYGSYSQFAWEEGFVSGAVYHGNDAHHSKLMSMVYSRTAYSNPLHPDVFPGIRMMEAEIVKMVSQLFKAPDSIGTVTSGGTESIFLVCKAYRDFARNEKGIKEPNMVIPVTAHAAFDKAAHMLNIKVKHIEFHSETTQVNIKKMKKAIDRNTCMLVGSAPAFPHGAIDSIEEIGKLGSRYKIPVHVDSCLGGFLVPFMQDAGYPVTPFDFSVKGVTSITVDTHKYAYAPKGTSVILYSDKKYRHYQYSVQPNWPGGIYGTPNVSGSRSGGLIAACWASLLYFGKNGYTEATKSVIATTRYIEKGLREIDHLFVYGKPEVSVLALGSKDFDIYRLCSDLSDKGWNLNVLQYPPGFHLCVTLQHTYEGIADKFLKHVRECVEEIMKDPNRKATGTAAIYGTSQKIPDRSIVSELVWAYLDACYSTKISSADDVN